MFNNNNNIFYNEKINKEIQKLERKKLYNEKNKKSYDEFIKWEFYCPFCLNKSNVYLIKKHIKTKLCLQLQNDFKTLRGEDKLLNMLSAINYNVQTIKNNYKKGLENADIYKNEIICLTNDIYLEQNGEIKKIKKNDLL